MFFVRPAILAVIPALVLFAACGGDDDNGGSIAGPGSSGSGSNSSSSGSGSNSSSSSSSSNANSGPGSASNKVTIPDIKDGGYSNGKLHIEISGDKDFKGDVGSVSGITLNKLTLLNFGATDWSLNLTFQPDSKSEAGAVAFQSKDIATAAEWGKQCSVTVSDSAETLKGEFSCVKVDATDIKAAKVYKVTIKGDFTAQRDKQ